MPILKSSKKRLRTNLKARMRNKAIRTRMRTAIKAVRQAEDQASAQEALQLAFSKIDKSAKHNVIHRNMAARYKSRLARYAQGLS